jgi:Na+/H+ antiporter NhaD/arsenite permease-like protein
MELMLVLIFIFGYGLIIFEHSIKLDKLIPALLMMAICWALISMNLNVINSWIDTTSSQLISLSNWSIEEKRVLLQDTMLHHFGKTAEILFFLMGAMAIVEMIDYFEGFNAVKKIIASKNKRSLLWTIGLLTFFLSAIIDNLTTTIVIITVLRKLIPTKEDRLWYTGITIIAANAGGAWSPIGDVTTTMLWISGKVSSFKLINLLFLPSLLSLLVPLTIASFLPAFKGNLIAERESKEPKKYGSFMLVMGLLLIVLVPLFKTIAHLPPYIGMMLSLAIYAVIAEVVSKRKFHITFGGGTNNAISQGPTLRALQKIELPSILFFLGILMTIAALESTGIILNLGNFLNGKLPQELYVLLIGGLSAIIDNVPLVAASIGMFSASPDDSLWHMIAYATGTGGSMLIIGSAAGVVAMGMENISFTWYLKNITWLAAIGYLTGLGVLLLIK